MKEVRVKIFDRDCTIKFNTWNEDKTGRTKFFINLISDDQYYKLYLASYPDLKTSEWVERPWRLVLSVIYSAHWWDEPKTNLRHPAQRSLYPNNISDAKRLIIKYLLNEDINL